MIQALAILDLCDAPGNIGAHLDLAIVQLKEIMEPNPFLKQTADQLLLNGSGCLASAPMRQIESIRSREDFDLIAVT